MKKKSTHELLNDLFKAHNIEQYIKVNEEYLIDTSLSDMLNMLAEEKGLTKSEVIRRADINEIYGFQIFSATRKPSRDKLICLCIGLVLTFDETQQFLKLAGFAPLYPKNKRDSIILYGIKKEHSIFQINEALYDQGEKTLN